MMMNKIMNTMMMNTMNTMMMNTMTIKTLRFTGKTRMIASLALAAALLYITVCFHDGSSSSSSSAAGYFVGVSDDSDRTTDGHRQHLSKDDRVTHMALLITLSQTQPDWRPPSCLEEALPTTEPPDTTALRNYLYLARNASAAYPLFTVAHKSSPASQTLLSLLDSSGYSFYSLGGPHVERQSLVSRVYVGVPMSWAVGDSHRIRTDTGVDAYNDACHSTLAKEIQASTLLKVRLITR
jgi:hypothetical protein